MFRNGLGLQETLTVFTGNQIYHSHQSPSINLAAYRKGTYWQNGEMGGNLDGIQPHDQIQERNSQHSRFPIQDRRTRQGDQKLYKIVSDDPT